MYNDVHIEHEVHESKKKKKKQTVSILKKK